MDFSTFVQLCNKYELSIVSLGIWSLEESPMVGSSNRGMFVSVVGFVCDFYYIGIIFCMLTILVLSWPLRETFSHPHS